MTRAIRHGLPGTVAFLALTAGCILSVTMLIWLAANGRSVLVVFPFCVGAWGCYLASHYLVEGVIIDRTDLDANHSVGAEEDLYFGHLPTSPGRLSLTAVGIGGMLLTFPVGIVAVGGDDLLLLSLSATLFVGGYIVGHQGLTGKPL